MSTHFMQPSELVQLRDWGLLDALLATGCPPCATVATHRGDFLLVGAPPLPDGVAAYAPRRTVLDKLLVDAAVAAARSCARAAPSTTWSWDDGRVAGVAGRAGGRAVRERARVVVGADGATRGGAPVGRPATTRCPAGRAPITPTGRGSR